MHQEHIGNRHVASFLFSLLPLPAVTGVTPSGASGNQEAIRVMGSTYESYLRERNGQPPKDEKTFRQYLATKQDELAKAGLTVDGMFVSPRSGKPLTWILEKYRPRPQGSG